MIAIPAADPTTEPCRAVPDVVLRREVCQVHGVGWPCAEPAELEREVRAMERRHDNIEAVKAALAGGAAIVCMARCTPCQFDEHVDPPAWHTWAEREDIDHAAATGQPDPSTSRCGCYCAVVAEGAAS